MSAPQASGAASGNAATPMSAACAWCEAPISAGLACNPRKYCGKCGRAAHFLTAAVAALKGLDDVYRVRARRQFLIAANAIQLPRRPDGRFVGGGSR